MIAPHTPAGKFNLHIMIVFAALLCLFCITQDLAQVETPDNVHMISTSPTKLAWMLAGVVYPAHADELPDVYVSDFRTAVSGHLMQAQQSPRNARATAARFIQKLLSKVR